MSFWSYLGNGFRMLLWKDKTTAINDVINDPEHSKNALTLLTIIAILSGLFLGLMLSFAASVPELAEVLGPLGSSIGFLGGFILGVVAVFALVFIGCGMTHLFAKWFGGKNELMAYVAATGSLSFAVGVITIPVMIVSLIPFLGFLVSIAYNVYTLVLSIIVVREVYKLSTGRAVAAVLLPALVILLILLLIGALAYFGELSASAV